ncbi:hypothetical protein D3C73_447990 [compost metagenome]
MNLLLAPLGAGIVLVEAGEIAVVAFVERLVLDRFKVRLADLVEHDLQRLLGALQVGGERNVELDAGFGQRLASGLGFLDPERGQVRVLPAGEQIFEIPIALAVANEDKSTAHENDLRILLI